MVQRSDAPFLPQIQKTPPKCGGSPLTLALFILAVYTLSSSVQPAFAAEMFDADIPSAGLDDTEKTQFFINAFVGGPLALAGGAVFRVVNGRERSDFEKDPIVKMLGGPEAVRAIKTSLRERSRIS